MIACCSSVLSAGRTALATCRAFWNSGSEICHDLCLGFDLASHPEQVPSLLNRVTDKSLPPDNAMIVDELVSDAAGTSTWPMALVDDMAVLP